MALSVEVPALLQDATRVAESLYSNWRDSKGFSRHEKFLDTWLTPLCACSPYLGDQCSRDPDQIIALLDEGLHDTDPGERPVWSGLDESEMMSALRRYRHKQMLRIICRDLLGYASLSETLSELSALAEFCVKQAEQYAHDRLAGRFGNPLDSEGKEQRLITLAMGKLGGRELNFSSDIDLILIYPRSGETTGPRKTDNGDFFRRLSQMMAKLLSTITEDGFVFRVDLRLRPFGDSGPLVMNFDGVENYYLTQGREWERYAMIKARCITGDSGDCDELMSLLKPFIYRRYLDYSAFESLRDLKKRIAAQVEQKGMQSNIKLGPGGIREIEFIGQAYQLVRGGREPEFQVRSILKVLDLLQINGLMEERDTSDLKNAYEFLRRLENCLQMMRDQQVHGLPDDPVDRVRLCYAMGFETWLKLSAVLDGHRHSVQSLFSTIFQTTEEVAEDINPYGALWLSDQDGVQSSESSIEWLRDLGFEQPEQITETLDELSHSAFYRNLTSRSQQRLDTLIPKIMEAVEKQNGSWLAFKGLLQLMRSVAGRSVYLQVLSDTPAALQLLTRLFSRSTWVAQFVCQHPIVIDELLDYRQLEAAFDTAQLEQEVEFVLERIRAEDLDVQMDALRQFKQAATIRLAVAELEGQLDLMRVSDGLSRIAEVSLQAVSDLVWDELVARYGRPRCRVDNEVISPGFAIVAYGKLGGLELGYASDLDLVFLHESDGDQQSTDGDRPIENQVFFARFAQKIVHFISTLTPAGVLYDTDMRLRPNGQSGMLVSGLAAFERYQRHEAWIWEHQALVRARVVIGNQRLRQRFTAIRKGVLSVERDQHDLCTEVVAMRQRMRTELSHSSGDLFDLKQDEGGIADIEFMVQYIVLWKSCEHEELTLDTDNFRILERAGRLGIIDVSQATQLREAYLDFRRQVHKLALLDQKALTVLDDTLAAHRSNVISIWQGIMLAELN